MNVVIIGEAEVASDLFRLFERAGLAPLRIALPDVEHSKALAGADIVVEASSLPVDAKRELLRLLARRSSDQAIICSDESVISRAELLEEIEGNLRQRFAVCHFFIPTEKLALVELVTGGELKETHERRLTDILEQRLARNVLKCGDTPGFVANRIGLFFAFRAVQFATELRLRPDLADALLAVRIGVPRMGAFGLFDLVGFETMASIAQSLKERLPKNDAWQKCDAGPHAPSRIMRDAMSRGAHRFYQKDPATGNRSAFDHNVGDFVSCSGDAVEDSRYDEFERRLRSELDDYCGVVVKSSQITPAIVDLALRQGFGWKQGASALSGEGLPASTGPIP